PTSHLCGSTSRLASTGLDINRGYCQCLFFINSYFRGDGSTILEITGDHDVNKEWFEEVDKKVLQHNSANPKSKKYIIPRYLMDKWDNTDYPKVFGSQASIDKAVNELLTHCVKNKFGGITIDFGYIGFKHNLRE